MSQNRSFIRRTAGILLTIVVALTSTAAEFTWDGGGDSQIWSDPVNWVGNSGYPDDTDDDAIFPYVAGGWDVVLIDEEILNIDVSADVDFNAGTGQYVELLSRSFTAADSHAITVTFSSQVTVASDPS